MNFSALFSVSCQLFAFVVLGFLLAKLGITDDVFSKKISAFVAKVAQPFLIMYSVVKLEYSAENLKNGAVVFGISILAHAFMAVISALAFLKVGDMDDRKLHRFACVFTNCGFVGFPVLDALFGDIGLFYGAFYIIAYNLAVWSYGVYLMSKGKGTRIKLCKILLNVGTLSSIAGLVIYISHLPLPTPVLSVMDSMAGLCTPLSLIVTGSLVAALPLKKLLANGKLYYFCAVKLIALPLLAAVILRFLPLSGLVDGIDLCLFIPLMIAMPSAAFTTLFANLYDVKPTYAAQLVCLSTLFSPVTLLLVMKLCELIL